MDCVYVGSNGELIQEGYDVDDRFDYGGDSRKKKFRNEYGEHTREEVVRLIKEDIESKSYDNRYILCESKDVKSVIAWSDGAYRICEGDVANMLLYCKEYEYLKSIIHLVESNNLPFNSMHFVFSDNKENVCEAYRSKGINEMFCVELIDIALVDKDIDDELFTQLLKICAGNVCETISLKYNIYHNQLIVKLDWSKKIDCVIKNLSRIARSPEYRYMCRGMISEFEWLNQGMGVESCIKYQEVLRLCVEKKEDKRKLVEHIFNLSMPPLFVNLEMNYIDNRWVKGQRKLLEIYKSDKDMLEAYILKAVSCYDTRIRKEIPDVIEAYESLLKEAWPKGLYGERLLCQMINIHQNFRASSLKNAKRISGEPLRIKRNKTLYDGVIKFLDAGGFMPVVKTVSDYDELVEMLYTTDEFFGEPPKGYEEKLVNCLMDKINRKYDGVDDDLLVAFLASGFLTKEGISYTKQKLFERGLYKCLPCVIAYMN